MAKLRTKLDMAINVLDQIVNFLNNSFYAAA